MWDKAGTRAFGKSRDQCFWRAEHLEKAGIIEGWRALGVSIEMSDHGEQLLVANQIRS